MPKYLYTSASPASKYTLLKITQHLNYLKYVIHLNNTLELIMRYYPFVSIKGIRITHHSASKSYRMVVVDSSSAVECQECTMHHALACTCTYNIYMYFAVKH